MKQSAMKLTTKYGSSKKYGERLWFIGVNALSYTKLQVVRRNVTYTERKKYIN